jgi:hypothetical protein
MISGMHLEGLEPGRHTVGRRTNYQIRYCLQYEKKNCSWEIGNSILAWLTKKCPWGRSSHSQTPTAQYFKSTITDRSRFPLSGPDYLVSGYLEVRKRATKNSVSRHIAQRLSAKTMNLHSCRRILVHIIYYLIIFLHNLSKFLEAYGPQLSTKFHVNSILKRSTGMPTGDWEFEETYSRSPGYYQVSWWLNSFHFCLLGSQDNL